MTKPGILAVVLATACGAPPAPAPQPPEPEPAPATATAAEHPSPEVATSTEMPVEPRPEPLPPTPPPPPGGLVQITVLSAEIDGRMKNDEHWDAHGAEAYREPEPLLMRYLQQHPELADTVDKLGVPIDAETIREHARRSVAADPMALVTVGDKVYRSPVKPRALNPLWEFRLQLAYGTVGGRDTGVPPDAAVTIHIVDYDGPSSFDTIGTIVIPLEELLQRRHHELTGFGSVQSLRLEVEKLRDEALEARSERVAIPGNATWTDTGIEIVAGQRITIDAADEVCTKGNSVAHCSGPEGQRKPSGYNLEGFSRLGHGALVGALGDTRFPVKRALTFVAPSTGRLRLGVNDRDTGNNSGSYAVRVIVEPAQ